MQPRRPSAGTGNQNGTDLRKLLNTVNEASQNARNAWLAYLFILAYLAVTLAGIDHKDLLLDTPTTLPFVNVQIPLTGFFTFAPVVLLFFHFGLLLQHRMLYGKALALKTKLPDETAGETAPEIRDEIHSYFFTQALVGRRNVPALQLAFRIMLFATFVFGPLTLLFYFQAKFLAYHDELMTWLHRALIVIDVIVLSTFGRFVRHFKDDESRAGTARFVLPEFKVPDFAGDWFARMRSWIADAPVLVRDSLRAIATAGKGIKDLGVYVCAVLFVSLFVASVPDGLVDRAMKLPGLTLAVPRDCATHAIEHDPDFLRQAFFLTALLYEQGGEKDACLQMLSLFGGSRNLSVTDADLVRDQEITKQNQHEMLHSLRKRDLRFADFSRSDLKQFDFERASLQGARFQESDLRRTRLRYAGLQGANLGNAGLQGANLGFAGLQGANLGFAGLQGANLGFAGLQGADLGLARLQGANLGFSGLQGANLGFAGLQGANLGFAGLQGADLGFAGLQGANLGFARVWLAVPPGEEPATLANYEGIDIVEDNNSLHRALSSQIKSFEKDFEQQGSSTPARERMAAVKQRLQAIIDSRGETDTEKSNQRIWSQIKASAPKPNPVKLACYLAELSCSDETDKAFLAQSLIGRVTDGGLTLIFDLGEPFQGSPNTEISQSAFFSGLQSCPAVMKRVPENIIARLEKAAAEDKTLSKAEKPPCGPGAEAPQEK